MTIMKSRILKSISGLLFISFIMISIYYGLKAQVSRPELCIICHMMKPEYFSWQASSHSEIPCINCHKVQGKQDFARNTKRLFLAVTGTYSDPIKALTPINDKVCEVCHNLNRRNVTTSGDVIIPHDVHKQEKVVCTRCHARVAHGDVADRKVTYRSDYVRWDSSLGKELMTEEFYRPKMDSCMRCHKARGAPLFCAACHRTRMLPVSHQQKDFLNSAHGLLALDKLKDCDSCHGYMSEAQFTDFQEQDAFSKYLTDALEEPKQEDHNAKLIKYKAVSSYAKINAYCKKCHRMKPPKHDKNFFNSHSQRAKVNKETCFVCHDDKVSNVSNVKTGCSNCHPSSHYQNFTWKKYHPIKFEAHQKIEKRCYQCHSVDTCAKCHKGSDKGVVTKT